MLPEVVPHHSFQCKETRWASYKKGKSGIPEQALGPACHACSATAARSWPALPWSELIAQVCVLSIVSIIGLRKGAQLKTPFSPAYLEGRYFVFTNGLAQVFGTFFLHLNVRESTLSALLIEDKKGFLSWVAPGSQIQKVFSFGMLLTLVRQKR